MEPFTESSEDLFVNVVNHIEACETDKLIEIYDRLMIADIDFVVDFTIGMTLYEYYYWGEDYEDGEHEEREAKIEKAFRGSDYPHKLDDRLFGSVPMYGEMENEWNPSYINPVNGEHEYYPHVGAEGIWQFNREHRPKYIKLYHKHFLFDEETT